MPRKKLTEEEKEQRRIEREAKKAAEEAEAQKLLKKKTIHDEIWAIVILAVGVFLALSLFTHTTGVVGEWVAKILGGIMGKVAYALPFFLIVFGILVFANKTAGLTWVCTIFTVILFILLSTIFACYSDPIKGELMTGEFALDVKNAFELGIKGGGVVGSLLGNVILKALGTTGLWIVGVVGCIISCLFIFNTPLSELVDNFKIKKAAAKKVIEEQLTIKYQEQIRAKEAKEAEEAKKKAEEVAAAYKKVEELEEAEKAKEVDENLPKLNLSSLDREIDASYAEEEIDEAASQDFEEPEDKFGEGYSDNQKNILGLMTDDELFGSKKTVSRVSRGLNPSDATKVTKEGVATAMTEMEEELGKATTKKPSKYHYPSIELLNKGTSKVSKTSSGSDLAEVLQSTLSSFGVDATVVNVTKGPAVTRFEVQPGPGVKVASISRLHDDLALNLRAKSLRIEAPIPGKAVVGIEVSNEEGASVSLREIIDSKEFKSSKSKITVALGRGIGGEAVVANLKDMPHLLIAGSTGSGKSVCINSMLISLMYKASPEELKLILIDPKVVELSDYNGIPHLLVPVVTEPAKASAALSWAVAEMNERYVKFANESVRDLASYNDLMRVNGEPEKVLPQIVIVIDELNDLMMAAKNSVEDSICRLAQKARAAGMHLVVATQRPSVDVLTGTIKANIPSRIAFAVSNMMDSRTILDEGGAEHLLGKGDMLYYPQGSSKPARVQGCFVSDSEISAVISSVKAANAENTYSEEIAAAISKSSSAGASGQASDDEDESEIFDAMECVVRAGECSVSMLQRRFRIGYNHAARLVDILEERGVVGPSDGARKRKVLMSIEEFNALERNDIPEEI